MNYIDFEEIGKFSKIPAFIREPNKVIRIRSRPDLLREFEVESWEILLNKFLAKNHETYEKFQSEIHPKMGENVYYDGSGFCVSNPFRIQRELQNSIAKFIRKVADKNDSIIELGAGYGAQLVNLRNTFPKLNFRLTNAELTLSGRKLSELLSKKYNLDINTVYVDLEDPKSLDLIEIESAIVFTAFALMYVKTNFEETITKILSKGPKNLIIIEPLCEDFDTNTEWGMTCKEWMNINDYNLKIKSQVVSVVKKFPNYKVLENKALFFGSNPFLPSSLVLVGKNDL